MQTAIRLIEEAMIFNEGTMLITQNSFIKVVVTIPVKINTDVELIYLIQQELQWHTIFVSPFCIFLEIARTRMRI